MKHCINFFFDSVFILQQEMGAMEESLESLRKELEGVEQEENKLRSKEVDIKHEMDKFESVLNENKSKVKHWKKEVKI